MAWQKLGSTKLTSAGDTITVDNLTAKKHLMIQLHTFTTGGNTKPALRFNNDTGSNYANRDSQDGGSDATETSVSEIRLSQDGHGGTVGHFTSTINVINESSKEKLVIAETIRVNATGAGTAPARYEITSKWANTTNQITRVDIINEGTGDFAADSEVTVYGTDSDSVGGDPITTNDLENNYIFEETDTGKHYLWSTTTSTWTEIA